VAERVLSPQSLGAQSLETQSLESLWRDALASLESTMEGMTADFARHADRLTLAGPNRLVAHFRAGYILHKESCERPERRSKLEEAISRLVGRAVKVDFALLAGESDKDVRPQPPPTARQLLREKEQHPLVRRAVELFDAEVVRIEPSRRRAEA
jgi:hypothetical protein